LHYAVQTLDSGTVRLLLQEGADPNVTDDDGHTPLDYAIGFADADCIRALRAHGAEARTELKGGPPPGSVPLPTQ
jgi:ankyrin repeat protein